MNSFAEERANELQKTDIFAHRSEKEVKMPYGENLYASTVLENLGESAIDSWYNEIKDYRLDDDEDSISRKFGTIGI